MASGLGPAQVGADLVGRDKLLVLVDDGSTERALLYDDRGKDESRSNLDEADFEVAASGGRLLALLLGILVGLSVKEGTLRFANLVVANPDFAIDNAEAHYVVDEGLGLSGTLGDAKCVEKQFFDDFEVGLGVESGIKGQKRSRALQTVAGEVQLLHGVHCMSQISVRRLIAQRDVTHNFGDGI